MAKIKLTSTPQKITCDGNENTIDLSASLAGAVVLSDFSGNVTVSMGKAIQAESSTYGTTSSNIVVPISRDADHDLRYSGANGITFNVAVIP